MPVLGAYNIKILWTLKNISQGFKDSNVWSHNYYANAALRTIFL